MVKILYDHWDNYIQNHKIDILEGLSINNLLSTTSDGINFLNIIAKICQFRLFDLSRISYLAFIFLDKYIESNWDNIINNNSVNNSVNNNGVTKKATVIDFLDGLLQLIINTVILIELTLNFHFLLLVMNLNLEDDQKSIPENFKKDLQILKYILLAKELKQNVKSSTLVLFMMKIIKSINSNIDILCKLDIKLVNQLLPIIKLVQKGTIEPCNQYLDNFIISLASGNSSGLPYNDKSVTYAIINICNELIISSVKTFYNLFDVVYLELVKYLITKYPDDEKRLLLIGGSIHDLLDMEILTMIAKFNS